MEGRGGSGGGGTARAEAVIEQRKSEYKRGIRPAVCVEKRAELARKTGAAKRYELTVIKRANQLPTTEEFEHLEDVPAAVHLLLGQIMSSMNEPVMRDMFIRKAKIMARDQGDGQFHERLELMIQAGFGRVMNHILGSMNVPHDVALDAAWILVNLSCANHERTEALFEAGVVPTLLRIISSTPSIPLLHQAIWALGNLSDSGGHRDIILQYNGLPCILERLAVLEPAAIDPELIVKFYYDVTFAISCLTHATGAMKPPFPAVAPALETSLNMLKVGMEMKRVDQSAPIVKAALRALSGIIHSKGCGEPQIRLIYETQNRYLFLTISRILFVGHTDPAVYNPSVGFALEILITFTTMNDTTVAQMLTGTGLFADLLNYATDATSLNCAGALLVIGNLAACVDLNILNLVRGNQPLMLYLRDCYMFQSPSRTIRIAIIEIVINLILTCQPEFMPTLAVGMGCLHILCHAIKLPFLDDRTLMLCVQGIQLVLVCPPREAIWRVFEELEVVERMEELEVHETSKVICSAAKIINEQYREAMQEMEENE